MPDRVNERDVGMNRADDLFTTEASVPGFVPPDLPKEAPTPESMARADLTARYWASAVPGPLRRGSNIHKREVCRMFVETFNPYRPSVIPWPKLDPETLSRITSLPIWDIAVQTEGKARLRMASYAAVLSDPEMRSAIALNAWEENRHKEVLSKLVAAYEIPLASEPPYRRPRDPEWAYLVTGYSECVDSFFAFGLFEIAKRSGFFPTELVETFEPVMQEECRHILLFANWIAWHRTNLSLWRRIYFELRVAAAWVFLGWERIGLARSMDAEGNEMHQDNNFTVSGAKSVSAVDVRLHELMALCLEENDRRFAGYDPRLLRPQIMPRLVRIALPLLRKRGR
jgi:hypothetical protein